MYMVLVAILTAYALGVGIWGQGTTLTPALYGEAKARAIAEAIYMTHSLAVRWVEATDSSGDRLHPGCSGSVPYDESVSSGLISFNPAVFGSFPTQLVAGATASDCATITWVTPDTQNGFLQLGTYSMDPGAVLRQVIDQSGGNIYSIGVYHNGVLEPLDRSSELAAPSNTKWSPMDNRDPSTINEADKPSATVHWVLKNMPQVENLPTGLVDGSWVLISITPTS